jgi:hypothetical protein
MDDFIGRIEIIGEIVSMLEENDKKLFIEKKNEDLEKINKILCEIELFLKKFKISKEKLLELEEKYHKDAYIMKKIFPYCWAFSEDANVPLPSKS